MRTELEALLARSSQIKEGPRLKGHTSRVYWVSFSPNGEWLASASKDNSIRLWSLTNTVPPRTLTGHTNWVTGVAWSPDGRFLASASSDNSIRIWNPDNGETVRQLQGHTRTVWSVMWSPDGRLLASGSVDKTIRLWNPTTGKQVGQLNGHTDDVTSIAWSPDGRFLASGSHDNTIRLWNPDSEEQIRQWDGHTDWVYNVAWSPDNQFLASVSKDKTVRIWSMANKKVVKTLTAHKNSVNGITWSPDGRLLVSGAGGEKEQADAIILWHAASGTEIARLPQEEIRDKWWVIRALAISPDGQWLASYPSDSLNDIQLWDISALGVGPTPQPQAQAQPISLQMARQQHAQQQTWPWRHVRSRAPIPADQSSSWLLGAGATGQALPLALGHDLGVLLTRPANQHRIQTPSYLPADHNTSSYQNSLQRIANHPLIQTIARWQPADAVISILLARLTAGIEWPDRYQIPAGPDGVAFTRRLGQRLAQSDSAILWRATPAHQRPDWKQLASASVLAQIESNLSQLNRDEVQFLIQYGAPLSGAPDARDLLDLLALTGLPAAARQALSQTLRLLPRLSSAGTVGGLQTYPEGGYEGLSRKGSLDSLLTSELAYDEDVFLHRIWNKEALYYGRSRPKEQRREVAYLVLQSGLGLGGDGAILSKAIALALAQVMGQRGYEVLISVAGSELSAPRPLQKPGEVVRLLYHREAAPCDPQATLAGVLSRLRSWREMYRSRQVLWILSDRFDADTSAVHAPLYTALQAEAGQQAWYVRTGKHPGQYNGHMKKPAHARKLGPWQLLTTDLLWQDRPPLQPTTRPIKPKPAWTKQKTTIEGYPFREGIHDVLHFTNQAQWAAWERLAEIEETPAVDDYLRSLAPTEMIYIPPGNFLMGSADDDPEAEDNEKPQHELWLRGYYIDKYPVTNEQYAQFMAAGGYAKKIYWTEAGWAEKEQRNWQQPREWDNERFQGERKPVVAVSWYEAMAYSRWAGKALPAEAQWEKAASWDAQTKTKRRYPWGDEWIKDYCHSSETGRGETIMVDAFSPKGDSYYGVADLAGNVNEWCRTRWGDKDDREYIYPYDQADGRENIQHENILYRILRGGSYKDKGEGSWSRCGFRYWDFPRLWDYYWGFRCVLPHVCATPAAEF